MTQQLRKSITVRVSLDLATAMDALRERDGIPPSEMIRRALEAFLEAKGVTKTRRSKAVARG